MGTNVYALKREPVSQEKWELLKTIASEQNTKALDQWMHNYSESTAANLIHIGKRSAGWKFCFNHNDWIKYDYRLETITEFLTSCYKIYDEYGRELSIDNFIKDFVLFNPTGFDGESYAKYELNRAKLKASGHPDYQSEFIPNMDLATQYYDNCKNHDWYMQRTCKGKVIPKNLPYYFSDSTEFS